MGLFQRRSANDDDGKGKDGASGSAEKEKVKWSHRPANTAFKQQRLKAWQPILTPATVLPTFFLIGLIFMPLGGVLLYGSNKVKEFTIDYTQCEFITPSSSFIPLPSTAYEYHLPSSASSSSSSSIAPPTWAFSNDTNPATTVEVKDRRVCRIQFALPVDMEAPVFMYYKLTNYYQNHRRYVKSISQSQLSGAASSYADLVNGDCKPVAVEGTLPVYPCGLIANSVFNDTFLPPVLLNPSSTSSSSNITYNMTSKGISWPGEALKYGATAYNSTTCVPPPFWVERYPNGYTATGATQVPKLGEDEHFMVWMRTAGLPTFRKLYFRNDIETMGSGVYQLDIRLNYPVATFGGTKSIVFSTVSFIGGRNPFLGIAYLVVGGACMLLGFVLTLRHLIRPRKLGDMRYLSWNMPGKEVAK